MPYQSIGFDLLYTDGKSISVNKDEGKYIFISDVQQYAKELSEMEPGRWFKISGTVFTDYENQDFWIKYDNSGLTSGVTEMYWPDAEDRVYFTVIDWLEDGMPIKDIMNNTAFGFPISEMFTEEELRDIAEENGYGIVESDEDE